MFSGGNNDLLGRIRMMTSPVLSPAAVVSGEISSPAGASTAVGPKGTREERGTQPPQAQPQWGHQETRDLIAIRAELERDFTVTKRNKTLWEIVSARMGELGYRRTPDQCKCKWKNLVNRYKGKETSDPEAGRQCPFFDEMQLIFTERAKNMQRLLVESKAGKKRTKRTSGDRLSDEQLSEDEDANEEDSEEERPARSNSRKRKPERVVLDRSSRATNTVTSSSSSAGIEQMLKEFFQQQQVMEMQWREMMERRACERQLFEQEWRQSMEKLERERLMVEQAWREREDERRMREESRAEKRDALLTTLLNKLIHEN